MTTSPAQDTAAEPGWADLAAQICSGLAVRPGDAVAISLTDISAQELCQALVDEIHDRGALPQVVLAAESFERSARARATDEVLATPAPVESAAIDWADVYVALRAMVPPQDDDPSTAQSDRRLVLQRVAKGEISTRRWERTRWAVVRVPTPEWSLLAGVDHEQVRSEVLAGCLMDWSVERERWGRLATMLDGVSEVRVQAEGTDLRLPVGGRTWAVFAGEANFPDGEVATAPLEDAVEGRISLPGPFWFADTRFEGLSLRLEGGRCVEVSAREGQGAARALLAADEGAGRVGELGIGVNHLVRTLVGDLFVDEKVLGTVHVAMGRAYPQCGGVNRSSLHWDLVADLRPGPRSDGGDLLVDGEALLRAGAPTALLLPYLDPTLTTRSTT